MAALITAGTLAKWTGSDPVEVSTDPFATDLMAKISGLACFIGGHDGATLDADGEVIPEWSLDGSGDTVVAPVDVQMVVLQVTKRSYENPGQVVHEGNIGPIGGNVVADVQALFADFTDSERRTLSKHNPSGDPTTQSDAGEVFVLQTTRGDETTLPQTSPLYLSDNLQVGLAGSGDPRSWDIPMFNPGDPGDDALYG